MALPAARIGDLHFCPMVSPAVPPVPHVGGPILPPGILNVLIGSLPAATISMLAVCIGPPDTIMRGSFNVLIGNRPAARMTDSCSHGGTIITGQVNVLIG